MKLGPSLFGFISRYNYTIITSPVFLFTLALLLFNDLYFKDTFHNEITGKLSDFSGLFIFPIFFSVLFPARRIVIYWCTAIFFVFWKSHYSTGIIDIWNEWTFFYYVRTVDYTDLIALLSLPLAYFYQVGFDDSTTGSKKNRLNPVLILVLCAYAFLATSDDDEPVPFISIFKTYEFNLPLDEILDRIERIDSASIVEKSSISLNSRDTFNLSYYSNFCGQYVDVSNATHPVTDSTSTFEVLWIQNYCFDDEEEARILQDYETEVIEKL